MAKLISKPVKGWNREDFKEVKKGEIQFSTGFVSQAFTGVLFPELALDLVLPGSRMTGFIKRLYVLYRFFDDSGTQYYQQTIGGNVLIDTAYITIDKVDPATVTDVPIPVEMLNGDLNFRFNLDNQRIIRVGFQPTRTGWNMAGGAPPAAVAPDTIELWVTAAYVFD